METGATNLAGRVKRLLKSHAMQDFEQKSQNDLQKVRRVWKRDNRHKKEKKYEGNGDVGCIDGSMVWRKRLCSQTSSNFIEIICIVETKWERCENKLRSNCYRHNLNTLSSHKMSLIASMIFKQSKANAKVTHGIDNTEKSSHFCQCDSFHLHSVALFFSTDFLSVQMPGCEMSENGLQNNDSLLHASQCQMILSTQ